LFTVTNKSLFRLNYEIHILKQGITLIFPKWWLIWQCFTKALFMLVLRYITT
jgi:hypothetical protein